MPDTDPTPATPTTIGDRMGWFRGDVNTKLDVIAAKLDTIAAALTGASGNIDAAPIVAAIQALAGPYPGKTLTDLHTDIATVIDHIGFPTGDATTTLLGFLAQVVHALTVSAAGNTTVYSKIHQIMNALILPNSIDNTILGELEAIRLLQKESTLALNPVLPTGACTSPYQSAGMTRLALPGYTTPATAATWSSSPPTGITTDGIDVTASDWSAWKVYVASKSTLFGYDPTSTNRYLSNKWWVFTGSGAKRFYVDGDFGVDVMICPSEGGGSVSYDVISATGMYNYWAALVPGYTYSNADIIGDASGHSFKFAANTQTRADGGPGGLGDPRIAYDPGVYRAAYPTISIDTWYHIGSTTTSFSFYSFMSGFDLYWADGIMPGSTAI